VKCGWKVAAHGCAAVSKMLARLWAGKRDLLSSSRGSVIGPVGGRGLLDSRLVLRVRYVIPNHNSAARRRAIMYTREEARSIVDRVIDMAGNVPVEVVLTGGERSGTRWANSDITTNLIQYDRQLLVTARLDTRTGNATTRDFSDDGIRTMVAEAVAAAEAAQPNPNLQPLLGPQEYIPVDAALPPMIGFGPGERALMVRDSIAVADSHGVLGYGYIPKIDQTTCRANSNGLFAYYRVAEAGFVLTCRTPDGLGSGWAGITGVKDLGMIDARALSEEASQKAVLSRGARPLEPGRYTVILEPRANARFLSLMTGALTTPGGPLSDAAIGDRVFSELFTLRSDIGNPILRQTTMLPDGRPAAPVTWVENGILRTRGPNQPATPAMSLVMEGGDQSLQQMIADTQRGLLVTFFWYIRGVPSEEQPLLNTGMTRDGLFLIENGEITGAVHNFRWNMSPLVGYRNLTAVGAPVLMHMGESYDGGSTGLIPPVRMEDFYMTSSSPAVE
jgi:predicted Zn-dependent protease